MTSKTLLPLQETGVSNVKNLEARNVQTKVGVMLQDPDILKNILPFSTWPALDDTLRTYRPTSRTWSLMEIRRAVSEKLARKLRRVG